MTTPLTTEEYALRSLPALRRADGVAARARRRQPGPRHRRVVRRVSHEGRDLWLVTVTDTSTGAHDTKPAHWVDASIHAVELTATVAACHLLHHLVDRSRRRRPDGRRGARARARSTSCRASTPTAPSGCSPTARGSAARAPGRGRGPTPTAGRASTSRTSTATAGSCSMRIADPDGAWMPHPDDARLLVPVPPDGRAGRARRATACSTRARSSTTTASRSRRRARRRALDLNRNFPAGWGTGVLGQRRPPAVSEPEIDALVRAIVARPNICGYNAFHTSGGVLLRPSSTPADSTLPPRRRVGVEAARRASAPRSPATRALGVRGLHVGPVGRR